jgi:signal transduction histidine kinase/CheY-like chemotaxis protein
VSDRYAAWLGVTSDAIAQGRPIAEVIGETAMESMRPHIEAVLAGKSISRDAEVMHPHLGRRWVHIDCVPTFSESGAADGWIEAIYDISEYRHIEDSLRENQGVLQSFYDSAPFFMGLAEVEVDSIMLLSINRALAESLRTTPEQTVWPATDFGTPDEIRVWLEKYREAERTHSPVRFEYERIDKSGSRWFQSSISFIGRGSEGRARFCFIAEEITEHKKTVDALRDANRSKDEFLAMLGHELRNPLAPIVTAIQILKLRGDGAYQKPLAVIDRQVQYLIRLVDDLLDVSRITRGKIRINRRQVRVRDVVAQGAEMAMPLVEERRHHLDLRFPDGELRVNGDQGRLAQVVANLITNSAKYTEPGGQITVECVREGADVVLRVKDNGTGITPELLPHVFDLFTQERQSVDRSQGGLGLGLSIVRNLVELHGGTVEAASGGPEHGSVFTVRLPAAEEPEAVGVSAAAAPILDGEPKRVLVVDDNEDALELLAEVLRSAGHTVETAEDGPGALRLLQTFDAQVAILDIGLPVMDGYELAERIRATLGEHAPRLIALTGYGQESDRVRAREAGFAYHLTKPVDIGCLLGAMNAEAGAGMYVS